MKTVVRAIAGYGLLGLLAFWCATPARAQAQAQADPVTPALIEQTAKTSFAEFFEMLALPNDAIKPEDIRKNADWLEAAFRKRGFSTRQLPNDGKPLVYAEYDRKVAGAKTILFYMHFDGQPVARSNGRRKAPGRRCSSSAPREEGRRRSPP